MCFLLFITPESEIEEREKRWREEELEEDYDEYEGNEDADF